MAFPKYFSELPNVEYALTVNKAGKQTSVNIKDYFHLLRLREDIFKEDTLYYSYSIQNGERPEQISYKEYGDEQYYWVVLQVNDIVDYYNQWPLSDYELQEFIAKKYGSVENQYAVHHYETVETKDLSGNIILPGGLVVTKDYVYSYPDMPGSTNFLTSLPLDVTNYEYEKRLNDDKREIVLIQKKYIYQFQDEYMDYARSLKNLQSDLNIADYYK